MGRPRKYPRDEKGRPVKDPKKIREMGFEPPEELKSREETGALKGEIEVESRLEHGSKTQEDIRQQSQLGKAESRAGELTAQEAHALKDKAADLDALHEIDFGRDTKFTRDIKIQTVATYMVTANLTRTAKIMGIGLPTVKWWKYQTDWWEECMSVLRRVKNDELDIKLTHVIDRGVAELSDRLMHGDETIYNGEAIRKKVNARDIATILGIAYDKRALGRGDPTQRSESKSADELQELANQFKSIAQQNQRLEKEVNESKVVDEQDGK